jgi:hypothetical protein
MACYKSTFLDGREERSQLLKARGTSRTHTHLS